ncbi:MAG: amidohydrolase family protein [Zoogloeaceae bacterium]|jgi:imidazolonepropionase-like amidohydrolase|nr:amidohydrolase family protein [Zoogloeaceae bacterium]
MESLLPVSALRRFACAILAMLALSATWASGANLERDPAAVFYIKADRLLDVRTGRFIARPVIGIRGEFIAAAASDLPIPEGARVLDLGKATLLPGLIDLHVHLGGGSSGAQSPARGVLHSARLARNGLDAGFTTLRSMGGGGYVGVALRDAIAAGDIVGPRIFDAGALLAVTGGHCSGPRVYQPNAVPGEGVADSAEGFRQKTRQVIRYGADFIKTCITGGFVSGTNPNTTQFFEDELRAIVETAHRNGKRVTVHAHGADGVLLAARVGVDSIEHGTLIDAEGIRLLRERKIFLIPTVATMGTALERARQVGASAGNLRALEAARDAQREHLARAVAAGVVIGFGSDFQQDGSNAREFSALLSIGATPLQAIQAATTNAARILGQETLLGAVEPGKYADIIAVDGDPLENIRTLERVRAVIKGGVIHRNDYVISPSR